MSRRKGNQTMRFGQLIEYDMRNIFLEKLYPKCYGEIILRFFSKKLKLSITLDENSKVSCSCFCCTPSLGYRNTMKLSCRPLAFTSYEAFKKTKNRSANSLVASFSAFFLKKNISLAIFC